jgi:hypothetical protein
VSEATLSAPAWRAGGGQFEQVRAADGAVSYQWRQSLSAPTSAASSNVSNLPTAATLTEARVAASVKASSSSRMPGEQHQRPGMRFSQQPALAKPHTYLRLTKPHTSASSSRMAREQQCPDTNRTQASSIPESGKEEEEEEVEEEEAAAAAEEEEEQEQEQEADVPAAAAAVLVAHVLYEDGQAQAALGHARWARRRFAAACALLRAHAFPAISSAQLDAGRALIEP